MSKEIPTHQKSSEQNFTFNLLKYVEKALNEVIDQGCFMKKHLLSNLLSHEIKRLDDALRLPCDPVVKSHVRTVQNATMLKPAWVEHQVMLPTDIVERIQSVCVSKHVVRDAFVNRAVFIATAKTEELIDFFDLGNLKKISTRSDKKYAHHEGAYELAITRLRIDRDPLRPLHEALEESGDSEWSEPGYLYRCKVFTPRPKTKARSRSEAVAGTDADLRARWIRHLLTWSITCWAEPNDLSETEFDLFDL